MFIATTGLKLDVVTIEVSDTCQYSLSILICKLVSVVGIGMCVNKMFHFMVGCQCGCNWDVSQ